LFFVAGMLFYVQRILIPHQQRDATEHDRPRGNLSDLYPRWLGARELLLHGRDPYSSDVTKEIQVGYYGRPLDPSRRGDPTDQQGFAYPVYVVFLLAPTITLPFSFVQEAAFWLLLISTVASALMWLLFINWRPPGSAMFLIILLTAASFPVIQGVKLQQLTLLVSVVIAIAAALLSRNHLIPAGILMAVATIKPQLAAPISGWLFLWALSDWRNRKRYAWSFVLSLAVLVLASEWILPGWISRFRDALVAYQAYTGNLGSVIDSLTGHFAGRILTVAMILMVLLLCWRARRSEATSPSFIWTTCLVLTVTIVIIPTIAPYNQVLLIPAVLQVVQLWPRLTKVSLGSRAVSYFCGGIVAWPWIGACMLMLLSLAMSPRQALQAWGAPLVSSLFMPLAVLLMNMLCRKWQETG
jgi:hypothetical protein